jgi:hypothetical protein
MSSASMTFGRPSRVSLPHGSQWFAALVGVLIGGLRRADRWQLSRQQREPRSAAEVMAWARELEHSQPGFAQDLRAAAQRSTSREAD